MAITIRTGANGSYKSAYAAYFVIYEALKSGRVVVTNIEGMQPLDVIQKRLDIEFPSTTRLIRIFSRDAKGIELWQHFFCWCPLGALIVIDECQDIFSKNIGFRGEKISYRPLSDFLPNLPKDYESFFYSRYIPADMSQLDASEVDDRGQAEYDDLGRIIYPLSFNEGFQRHRKYNWDIELLSPDWGQIDSSIRAPAEQCFFHKGRDQFFWSKRKPYIYKHAKNVSTPTIPKRKDPNLIKKKIPLEAFLLYKSTATGVARSSGALNVLTSNPALVAVFMIIIFGIGYLIYGLSRLVFGDTSQVQDTQSSSHQSVVSQSSTGIGQGVFSPSADLSDGRRGDSSVTGSGASSDSGRLNRLRSMLGLYDIQNLYYTGHSTKQTSEGFKFFVTLEAKTPDGTYYFDDNFLFANNIEYVHYDSCLLKLQKQDFHLNVFCKPRSNNTQVPQRAEVKLNPIF